MALIAKPLRLGLPSVVEWRLNFSNGAFIPPAGERMAREQPALEFLYREIDRLSANLDKDALRTKFRAEWTRPASDLKRLSVPVLFISGKEDVIFPPPAAVALANL